MDCCNRLAEIEARLAARGVIDNDTRWLLDQVRSWQNWAGRVVEYGGLVDKLRANQPNIVCSDARVKDVVSGYERLFQASSFGN